MPRKYRQGKERKEAGEEERGAGKRQGEIGKDDYTDLAVDDKEENLGDILVVFPY